MENRQLPEHIAIIMDGNRRWAKQRGLDPKLGHKEGAKTFENIARYANKIGIKYLTVYAFSTENWKRTEEEISALMLLLKTYLVDFSKKADTENIKINVIGDINSLKDDIRKSIIDVMERTKTNTGLTLNIAFNYGGRAELVYAFKNIAKKIQEGKLNIEDITEDTISDNIYTRGQPDPKLVIRTSGEIRTSNFLPWQIVYSEIYPLKKYWPDFTPEDLDDAIEAYYNRKINLGK